MMPIAAQHLHNAAEIQRQFHEPNPLSDFVILPEFLDSNLAHAILSEALSVPYASWCGYSSSGDQKDLTAHFCEPNEDDYFVTVHQRPTQPVRVLDEVGRTFARAEAITALREMTGLPLTEMRPFGSEILTRWIPGSFLNEHTDAGPEANPTLLVISLSLTRDWREDFGGSTIFKWEGGTSSVRTWPTFNSAVLFRAHPGSTHWVNRVEEHASHNRFTFTLHFT